MIRIYITLVFVLALASGIQGQVKRKPVPKAPEKPVTTQSATTDDGKRVVLRSDGTWAFDVTGGSTETPATQPKETSKTETKAAPVKTGNIDLEAGLVFNSGDVKPVGRATFYLLKEDPSKVILTQANLDVYNSDKSRFGTSETLEKWSMYGAVLYMDGALTPNFALAVKKSIDAASVAQATTGFDGKASFEGIPAGDYFLFGYYKFGKQTTYWRIPITVKAGANKVVLDNENMRG
ncbi:MAG: hypothetical protein ACKVRN_08120 [Pyrinomonadaceae bacterium]